MSPVCSSGTPMNLLEFADKVPLGPSFSNIAIRENRLWGDVYQVIGNESRTDPTVAAILSQIVLDTPQFTQKLLQRRLTPAHAGSREVMVLPRSAWGEYVLLVADDDLPEAMSTEVLVLDLDSVQHGLHQWRHRTAGDRHAKFDSHVAPLFEVYQHLSEEHLPTIQSFAVYFVRRPRRVLTSAPIPGWKIQSIGIKGWTTAGCRVQHADGRTGVTSARHFFPGAAAYGTAVTVGTLHGIVAEEDSMSDSVFIHIASGVALSGARGAKGWLQRVAPRVGDTAEFDGATAARTVKTAVSATDPGVVSYSPYRQARVYTAPVTNPGDSGAALVESTSDLVVGFAHERTEAGALVEWSSWIWADSVFKALNVRPQ
jgi:hypothetical protein